MAGTVVFALPSRPGLASHEALDIADRLAELDDPAARSAAAKIREEASGEQGNGVELDREELRQLGTVLESMRSLTDFRAALGRLHADVASALRGKNL